METPSSSHAKANASQTFKGCVKLKVPEGKGIKEAPNSDLTCTGKAEFLKLKYIYVVSSAFHLSNLAVRHSVKYYTLHIINLMQKN